MIVAASRSLGASGINRRLFSCSDRMGALRDDAVLGRIDLSGAPRRDREVRVTLRELVFECSIHITGRTRWTWVKSRWLMHSNGNVLHGVTWKCGEIFLTDSEAGQEPLLLRRKAFGSFTVERASDQARVGEIRRTSDRLLPKPAGVRFVLDMTIDLHDTFTVMPLWDVVQDEYRSTTG